MTAEEKLTSDVRAYFSGTRSVSEVKMFGGIAFMLNGNMVAAVSKCGLLLRVGKHRHDDALKRPGTRPMEMRGRTMEGYLYVDPATLKEGVLKSWLDEASEFVRTMRPKAASGNSTRAAR